MKQDTPYAMIMNRNGTCCVLLAFELPTGLRYVQVRARRTAVDYAQFMQGLVRLHYPTVYCIRLAQGNLHTQTPGSFYQTMPLKPRFSLPSVLSGKIRRRKVVG